MNSYWDLVRVFFIASGSATAIILFLFGLARLSMWWEFKKFMRKD